MRLTIMAQVSPHSMTMYSIEASPAFLRFLWHLSSVCRRTLLLELPLEMTMMTSELP